MTDFLVFEQVARDKYRFLKGVLLTMLNNVHK